VDDFWWTEILGEHKNKGAVRGMSRNGVANKQFELYLLSFYTNNASMRQARLKVI